MTSDPSPRRVVTDGEITGLRRRFRGPLFRPGDPGYDPGGGEGRAGEAFGEFLWNSRFAASRPAMIARPGSAADVMTLVDFAREGDWHPAVRGGGHSTAGFAEADDDIVIDLSLMRGVHVDPHRRTARVGGGATWWDMDRNTQVFGLAAVGGAIGHTGVAGLALGGGHGKLTRKYGMASDNLIAADVVTADGALHVTDAGHEPDLLWALRGGSGNFGVVTALEFRLHPVRDVWLDMNWWPADATADVVRFWRDWSRGQPPELATSSIVVHAPGDRGLPPSLVGQPFVVVTNLWHGQLSAGREATRPVRELGDAAVSISRETTYDVVQSMNDGIANADYGYRDFTKTGYLTDLTDKAVDTYAEWAPGQPGADGLVELIAVDGPMNRMPVADSPLGARTARFNHIIASGWKGLADDAAQIDWANGFHAAMAAHYDAGVYLNYLDRGEPEEVIRQAYGPNWDRMRALKSRYDPDNLFRRNHNIPPAGAAEGTAPLSRLSRCGRHPLPAPQATQEETRMAPGQSLFDHVGISVADLEGACAWYCRALGLTIESQFAVPGTSLRGIMLRHGSGYRIELLHRPDSGPGPEPDSPLSAAGTRGYGHICLCVEDVDAEFARLIEAGATVRRAPGPAPRPDARFAFLADPEGNLVELLDRKE